MDYYYFTSGDDSLQHHGIKGQKWGVRRFQNPDGTLTEKGKARAKLDSFGLVDKNDPDRFKKIRTYYYKDGSLSSYGRRELYDKSVNYKPESEAKSVIRKDIAQSTYYKKRFAKDAKLEKRIRDYEERMFEDMEREEDDPNYVYSLGKKDHKRYQRDVQRLNNLQNYYTNQHNAFEYFVQVGDVLYSQVIQNSTPETMKYTRDVIREMSAENYLVAEGYSKGADGVFRKKSN